MSALGGFGPSALSAIIKDDILPAIYQENAAREDPLPLWYLNHTFWMGLNLICKRFIANAILIRHKSLSVVEK